MAKTKETANEVERINPSEYVYPMGVNIEFPGGALLEMLAFIDKELQGEIRGISKFKYQYINAETSKIVKNVKDEDVQNGKVRKVLNWDATILDPTIEYSLTEKGVELARLKKFLEQIHMNEIDKKNAIHYREMANTEAPQVES